MADQDSTTFTLYDRSGNPTQVPQEHVQDALLSGQYGVAKGTTVPVEYQGQVGQIAPDRLANAVQHGARVIPQSHYEQAALQRDYGDVAHGLEAFGYNFLNSALLDLPSDAVGAIGGEDARRHIRNINAANPTATTAGKIAGVAAPIVADVFSGGSATPLLAPEIGGALEVGSLGEEALNATRGVSEGGTLLGLGAREAETAEAAQNARIAIEASQRADNAARAASQAVAPSMLGDMSHLAGTAFTAPTSYVSKVGDLVEQGVKGLIGDRATGLMGKLAQKGLAGAARAGTETALFGTADLLGEESLKDKPELTGEKLWNTISQDFLTGAVLGGGLTAGGLLAREARAALPDITGRSIGGGASHLANLADENLIRAINPDLLQGVDKLTSREQSAIKRTLIDQGVVRAGDSIGNISDKIAAKTSESEQALYKIYRSPELEKLSGIPLSDFSRFVDETLPRTSIPELGDLGIDAEKLKSQVFEAAGAADSSIGKLAEGEKLNFRQTADIADMLSRKVGEMPTAQGKLAVQELLGRVENFIDINLDKQAQAFAKEMEASETDPFMKGLISLDSSQKALEEFHSQLPEHLLQARSATQLWRRLQTAAQESVERAGKEGALGKHPLAAAIGLGGGIGALTGHVAAGAAGAGIIGAVAKKLIAERGRSTAAVLLDKLATIGAARRAALGVDREIESSLNKIYKRVVPNPSAGEVRRSFDQYARVVRAWEDKGQTGFQARVDAIASTMATHAPRTAQSFQSTAMRSMAYLVAQFPRPRPDPSALNPNWDMREPSDAQKSQAARLFQAVANPVTILGRVADGTLTARDVDTVKTVHPEIFGQLQLRVAQTAGRMKDPPSPSVQRAMNTILEKPVMDPTLLAILQEGYASQAAPTGAPGGGKGKGKGTQRPLKYGPAQFTGAQSAGAIDRYTK